MGAIGVNKLLGLRRTRIVLFRLAVLYMVLALFQEPLNDRVAMHSSHRSACTLVAEIVFWIINAIFGCVFCVE